MFGASNSGTTGGLFGSANTNANSAGTAFGKPNGGGLFGGNTSSSGFGQANSNAGGSTGFSFGSNTAAAAKPATSGFSFGNSAGSTANTQPTTLFGQNNATANTAGTGGLFGANNAATSAGAAPGSLFGQNKPAAPATSGLFGQNNTANPSTGGGLFGQNNTVTNTASSGLFGQNSATSNAPTSGLFGQNTTPTANTSTGGLFGQKPAGSTNGLFSNNAPAASGGLFGQKSSSGVSFGMAPSAPTNLLGQQQTQPSFGFAQTQQQQQQQIQPQSLIRNNNILTNYTPTINDQLVKVVEQWDPTSDKCLLKTHFYNKVNDNEALLYQRPSNESPEDWELAMSKRPDNSSIPIKVAGFDDVQKRVDTQVDYVKNSRFILQTVSEKQKELSNKHDLDTATRITAAKAKHVQLSRRILKLATLLAIIKLKGYPLLPEEEQLSREFEELNKTLMSPTGLGRINEIFARLSILKDRATKLSSNLTTTQLVILNKEEGSGEDNDEKNSEVINKISQILYKQQVGLNYLNEVLEKDNELLEKLLKEKASS